MLDDVLWQLEALVGFDTRNPPRRIDPQGLFAYLRSQLDGFATDVTDHGAGAVSLLAVRGTPTRVFNVHMDTVPDSPGWSGDPFRLRVDATRAIGLGACDIKGAAAALLAAANASSGDAAFLFSSDEEANDPRCIAAFLARGIPYDAVLVAEPTQARAVLAHRGIASVLMRFSGRAAHASGVQTPASTRARASRQRASISRLPTKPGTSLHFTGILPMSSMSAQAASSLPEGCAHRRSSPPRVSNAAGSRNACQPRGRGA